MANTTVSFTQMKDGTKEDYLLLHDLEEDFHAATGERILAELRSHGESTLEGYKITRLEHALQSATRAEADGADIDWIVGALLHDVGHLRRRLVAGAGEGHVGRLLDEVNGAIGAVKVRV